MSEPRHPSLNVTLPGGPRRRRGPGSLAVSLVVHGLILAAIVLVRSAEPWERTRTPGLLGGLPGGGGGGGGGDRVAYVALPPAPAATGAAAAPTEAPPIPEPVVPPPQPDPEPEPVEEPPVEQAPVPAPPIAAAGAVDQGEGAGTGTGTGAGAGAGSGGGTGGGTGGGEGTGIGTGTGPGTGGEGGTGRPPEPRQLILPPLESTPKALRGQTVRVTFWVRSDGGVERITVEPEIADRGYAAKFEEAMVKYRFRPARDAEGRATTGSYTIDVELTAR